MIWYLVLTGFALPTPAESSIPIQGWLSSQDMRHKLSPLPILTFIPAKPQNDLMIQIDPSRKYQSIIGLGSSLEHSTCYNISLLPPKEQEEVMEKIVDSEKGIGMNLMRICVGTPDFTGSKWYSYDDMPLGHTDPQMSFFSIDKDRKYVLPILKLAQKKNPDMIFFAAPWSPPAWMKTNEHLCGGKINPQHYRSYARYLVKFIQAYQAEDIDIYSITPQNEPLYYPDTYPTCGWKAEQQRDFIRDHLGPVFQKNKINTKIWSFDHNFKDWKFPETILKDSQAAQYADGTSFHCYEGKPAAMTILHEKYPDKHVYFTEGSTFGIPGAIKIIQFFRNWARSYNAWVTIIDHKAQPNPGPHYCSPTCIVLNSKTLDLEYRFDYYMYGQFMKFIDRDAVRIDSTSSKTLPNVAFKNPDSSIVFVAVNPGKKNQMLAMGWEGRGLEMRLPAESIATLTWKP